MRTSVLSWGLAIVFASGAATAVIAAEAPSCPSNLRAAVDQACPCTTFGNHAEYMNCVKTKANELEKMGCSKSEVGKVKRCASMSTCGETNSVVCCEGGHARVVAKDRCTERGGTIESGGTSSCYARCQAAAGKSAPNEPRPRRTRGVHRGRQAPNGE
jgi:hypothetical protein